MKKLFALLLSLPLCLVLCSCGGTSDSQTCTDCEGQQMISCDTCNGSGTIACPVEACQNGTMASGRCTNCGGREGVDTCSTCHGNKTVTLPCEICGGDKIVINPFTWEKFQCNNCDASGEAIYLCSKCEGYGLVCNYCERNLDDYPNEQYYPYTSKCSRCDNTKEVRCEACMGAKQVPCSTCSGEEYEQFLQDSTMQSAIFTLTGLAADQTESYLLEDEVDLEVIESTKKLLNTYNGDFDEKEHLLKQIEAIEPYVCTTWELIDGIDTKIFEKSLLSDSIQFYFSVIYDRDKESFYIWVRQIENGEFQTNTGKSLYIKDGIESSFATYNNACQAYLTENGTLQFVEYDNDGNVVDSCELQKIDY